MKTFIYLVHGTWGRGFFPPREIGNSSKKDDANRSSVIRWFEEGSPFRQFLQKKLGDDLRFVQVDWSGRNSLWARQQGAAKLREALQEGFKNHPDGRHVVVAHSHGGNVAVYALNGLKQDFYPHGIAALAAPFLEATRRGVTLEEVRFLHWMSWQVVLISTIVFISLSYFIGSYEKPVLACSVFVFGIIVMFIFTHFSNKMIGLENRILTRKLLRTLRMPRRGILRAGRPEFFIARAPGDEASVTLTLVSTFGLLNRLMWSIVSIGARAVVSSKDALERSGITGCLGCLFWIAVFSELFLPGILVQFFGWDEKSLAGTVNRFNQGAWGYFLIGAAVALLLGIPIFLLVGTLWAMSGLLLMPFGPELMLNGPFVILTARHTISTLPARFVMVPRSEVTSWLKHSVYESPTALAGLVNWIESLHCSARSVRETSSGQRGEGGVEGNAEPMLPVD